MIHNAPNVEQVSHNRRGFLRAVLAAGMAPAVVKAGILMPVVKPIWTPRFGLDMLFEADARYWGVQPTPPSEPAARDAVFYGSLLAWERMELTKLEYLALMKNPAETQP